MDIKAVNEHLKNFTLRLGGNNSIAWADFLLQLNIVIKICGWDDEIFDPDAPAFDPATEDALDSKLRMECFLFLKGTVAAKSQSKIEIVVGAAIAA